MGRSFKKGPYVDEKVFIKVGKLIESGSREPIKTWARRCTIIPEFVGFTFMVHNGKMFHKVFVTEDMVGHKAPCERKGDESGCSPDGRRRGQVERWATSLFTHGRAGKRWKDKKSEKDQQ